jgi:hypothetical protein
VARGFHRIEKAVGVLGTTEGQEEEEEEEEEYARRLMEDATNLREGVETVELEPEDLLTGSVARSSCSTGYRPARARARRTATRARTSTTQARTSRALRSPSRGSSRRSRGKT